MFKQAARIGRNVQLLRPLVCASRPQVPTFHTMRYTAVRTYAMDTLGQKVDSKVDPLTASEYDKVSNIYLEDLGDELDIVSEDHDTIDFDLSQGVLTLNTPKGTYVINRQPPNKQIWSSSPLSGPNRYDLVKGQWVSLRDNERLTDLMSRELSDILGASIQLQIDQ